MPPADPGFRSLLYTEPRLYDERAGFEVVGLYDNRRFEDFDLAGAPGARPDDVGGMAGRKLYAFARRR